MSSEQSEYIRLSVRGQRARIGFTLLVAAFSMLFADWRMVAAAASAAIIWDLWLCPLWLRRTLNRRFEGPAFDWRYGLISGGVGGVIYGLLPITLWLSGGQVGAHMAHAWVAGTAMHVFLYFSRNRRLMLIHMAPNLAALYVGSIAVGGWTLETFLIIGATLTLFASAALFAQDRNALLDEIAKEQESRTAAEVANAAKSQFLATMSHELRTPLNAIIGYSEIMREDIAQGAMPQGRDSERISAAGRHLLGLINEVLDMSRLEAGRIELHPEPCDLHDLLATTEDTLAPLAASNNNSLRFLLVPGAPKLLFDRQRVMQCLLNLGSNACKFTQNGAVTINCATANEGDVYAVTFKVADTGCGISAEDQARLFESFVQVDSRLERRHQGAGLGLAITRRLARLMGGDVTLDSAPGQGSTFTLRIRAPAARSTTDFHANAA
jgi:signal transduction histidine kinase